VTCGPIATRTSTTPSRRSPSSSLPNGVVWHVLDGYLNFTEDKTEWTGTDIAFDVSPEGNQTEVRFTHLGLVPEFECFRQLLKRVGLLHQEQLAGLYRHRSGAAQREGIRG